MSDTPPSEALAKTHRAPDPALLGHGLLLVVQLCFGLFHAISKVALLEFEPRALAAARLLTGALVLAPLAYWRHREKFWPSRKDLLRLQAMALTGLAINQLLYLEGMRRSPAGTGGLIMALIPVFTVIIATSVGQERMMLRRLIGVLIAICGSLPLILARVSPEMSLGTLYLILNACSYSIYLVLSRPLSQRLPPLVVIAWVFLLSAWTVPFFLAGAPLIPPELSDRGIAALAYILIFPTVLAYLFNVIALSRVPASTVALYILLQPVIAAVAGLLLFAEPWIWQLFLAQFGVLVGIVLISVPWPKRAPA